MTLKTERRNLARKLRKQLRMPFIMTKKLAKIIVDDGFWALSYTLPEKGAVVNTRPYCDCCGPSSYDVTWEGETFSFDVFRRELWNERAEVQL